MVIDKMITIHGEKWQLYVTTDNNYYNLYMTLAKNNDLGVYIFVVRAYHRSYHRSDYRFEYHRGFQGKTIFVNTMKEVKIEALKFLTTNYE